MYARLGALLLAAGAAAALVPSAPAAAGGATLVKLLEVLHAQGTLDRATFEQLKSAALAEEGGGSAAGAADEAIAASTPGATKAATLDESDTPPPSLAAAASHTGQADTPPAKPPAEPQSTVTTRGKLAFTSPDGSFSWRLGGRLHVDSVIARNDRGTGAETRFEDRSSLRRARFTLTARMWERWLLKLAYDFADTGDANDRGTRDAWVRYDFPTETPMSVTFGHQHELIAMEEITSSNHMTFIERSLAASAFDAANGRRIGLSGDLRWRDRLNLAVGAFGRSIGRSEDDGLRLTGRMFYSPIHQEGRVVHIGGAGSWISSYDNHLFSTNPRPEFNEPGGGRLLPLTLSGVNRGWRAAAEGLWIHGSWSLQGEYQRYGLERDAGLADPTYDGWYVQGTWTLTGEPRGYSFSDGRTKRPKPRHRLGDGGWGAFELAVRMSALDLLDQGVGSGRQQDLTLGLNWYPTPNIRFLANWIKVLDLEGGTYAGAEPSAFALSGRIYW